MQNTRSLRAVLFIACAINLSFASLFFFSPSLVERLYGIPLADPLHYYFSLQHGALFFVLAALALLAFLRPEGFRLLSLALLLHFFALFVADVVLLAREMMPFTTLLPEMVYFVLMSGALIRFMSFSSSPPVPQKVSAESPTSESPLS
ncbi:MAG TPA: hypothetical protein DEB30_04850 [Candidatus Peribacter riflensis]|uniref:DUF4345 domain-containing protein n=1 Tax=Candidatus Peribacter riflensis TaxID=1735162 RepID=A0A0S1SNR8_9BACT|nr:MAG: hypothetical protein PeribacterA2_0199 [Candidatus Peribacter riflensis]OGJ76948.1 MAG: hypothetical protein A2398_01705 [Candidatus Peribacteria bacterium RIFOXYB1_FULL_57_12]ALM10695.1 MAG: hypothetical protein PeribacterB2_0199 [Candidatus Peribacter riflensis]ALM11797.1 MAG: hypothetical protein PeribacterC2_0198 [Candidatus Peribacter riflensis]ALM12900.1 MAG: hypothetical protein PeribacterD1_0199 [Candidatus Peribacter riflensis]